MFTTIIKRTLRVPLTTGPEGDSAAVARQIDIALIAAGFKLSRELLEHLSSLDPVTATDAGRRIVSAVQELLGDHVKHNTFFINFPKNIPDTVEFWQRCLAEALADPHSARRVSADLLRGIVNLLNLPRYGKYQHSYEEMLAEHDKFVSAAQDRLTILQLGLSLPEETQALYLALAGSAVPLSDSDRKLLAELAELCPADFLPERIPIRENKALINRVRLARGLELLVDTVTDVLRLACLLSGGDATLQEKSRFRSLHRAQRRALMRALGQVLDGAEYKLTDVRLHAEPWKRLGERLHPHEFPRWPQAQAVFAVARDEIQLQTLGTKVEAEFVRGQVGAAISLLKSNPGLLMRSLDRIVRHATPEDMTILLEVIPAVAGQVSGRVLLALCEHLSNRVQPGPTRIFINKAGRSWVAPDTRGALDYAVAGQLSQALAQALLDRLPVIPHLVVDPAVCRLALPLSQKHAPAGFNILPRGSLLPVASGLLRFFIYWKERRSTTDYDLSALLLDDDYRQLEQLSWTNLRAGNGRHVHSGDITSSPRGASEFIEIDLSHTQARYLVPQVNVFSGENFDAVSECFFGYMSLDAAQRGAPFEPAAVQMKSDLRGAGRVNLPLAFVRDERHGWSARWLHLVLRGQAQYNRVEENRVTTALLTRSLMERRYLTLGFLVELLRRRAGDFSWYETGMKPGWSGPVTYLGLAAPGNLPPGSAVYTLSNLQELVGLTH